MLKARRPVDGAATAKKRKIRASLWRPSLKGSVWKGLVWGALLGLTGRRLFRRLLFAPARLRLTAAQIGPQGFFQAALLFILLGFTRHIASAIGVLPRLCHL